MIINTNDYNKRLLKTNG